MPRSRTNKQTWPHDTPTATRETRVVRLLIHDWRWQRFDETAVANPDDYPIYGWLRTRLEETESGSAYEVREWNFHVDRPATMQAKAVA